MTDNTADPRLQTLFAEAQQELVDDAFTDLVMEQTGNFKHRKTAVRISQGLVLVLALALLAIPLQDAGMALTQVLLMSLIELEDGPLNQLLAPANSIGGLLSTVLLGLRLIHKRIFS